MDVVRALLGLALICSLLDHYMHLGSALKGECPVLVCVFAVELQVVLYM